MSETSVKTIKLRFLYKEDYCIVKARKNGKWEEIGTCHLAAVDAIKHGRLELIKFKSK